MKRVYVAVAILILLPAMIMLAQLYLKNSTSSMCETIKRAQNFEETGDIKSASEEIKTFGTEWETNKAVMETFIRHAELDTVNQNYSKLKPYLDNSDKADFNAECEEIKTQLDHIYRSEKFSLDNIL